MSYSEKQKYLDNIGFDPILNDKNVEFEQGGSILKLTICNLDKELFEALAENFLIKKGQYNSHFEQLVQQHDENQTQNKAQNRRKKRPLKTYNISYITNNINFSV